MQRRVEQADRHRQARHRLEDPLEVAPAGCGSSFVERRAALVLARREDHLPHERQPVLGHEHVLGPAEADALARRTRAPSRRPRACRRWRGPSGGAARRPSARIVWKSSLICGGTSSTSPRITRPVPPSIVIMSPSASSCAADRHRARREVDREPVAAGDARLAHPARDDGRVRGHAAVRGEDPLRLDQPVDVVRGRLPADEDHVLALAAALLGGVRRRTRSRRTAAPGEAFRPCAATSSSAFGSIIGCSSWSSWPGSIRATASSREIRPSSTIETAAFSAAAAVRLAERVCSR